MRSRVDDERHEQRLCLAVDRSGMLRAGCGGRNGGDRLTVNRVIYRVIYQATVYLTPARISIGHHMQGDNGPVQRLEQLHIFWPGLSP